MVITVYAYYLNKLYQEFTEVTRWYSGQDINSRLDLYTKQTYWTNFNDKVVRYFAYVVILTIYVGAINLEKAIASVQNENTKTV